MKPTLLVLAAGMGSRYGGLKQVDPVGPNNEIVLDYSLYDAQRAGFGKTVFVIREELESTFRKRFERCQSANFKIDYAVQKLDDLPGDMHPPPQRTKPWGTGQAVLAARNCINEPFAVINADDFYGPESYRLLADFLKAPPQPDQGPDQYTMVGFKLKNTLSDHGAVARGICTVDGNGILQNIEEHTQIAAHKDGAIRGRNAATKKTVLAAGSLVSMNMWGFTPDFLTHLERLFENFLHLHSGETKTEFYLPAAVDNLINEQKCRVMVKSSPEEWFGVTYRQDRDAVVSRIAQRIKAGIYPESVLP
ncbi:MAG: nucleotidyltransferase [Lentisphaeria bacterium]